MHDAHHRIQRREFKDYQPLFMLINSLDIIDEATRRDFVFKHGPVWRRYHEATKGAAQRRITVLFLGNEHNTFDELMFVGCDYVRRRQHHCQPLWSEHPSWPEPGPQLVRRACIEWAGRSILRVPMLAPEPSAVPTRLEPGPDQRATA